MHLFNNLQIQYNEFHADVDSLRNGLSVAEKEIENKLKALCSIISSNKDFFASSVFDHSRFYQLIINDLEVLKSPNAARLAELAAHLTRLVENIQYRSRLSRIASEPKLLAAWLNECPNAVGIEESDFKFNPEKVLRAFDALQRGVKPPKTLQKSFDIEVSKMVVHSLKLSNLKEVRSLKLDPELKSMAIGHLINAKEIPLSKCGLSIEELKQSAPYLIDVDCKDLEFKDDIEAQEFVQSCSNMYYLNICSDKITELKPSSSKLQDIFCNHSPSLKKISLSNLLSFESLCCQKCPALTELVLLNLPTLRDVYCTASTSLETLIFSNLPLLEKLGFLNCTALRGVTFENFPGLKELDLSGCTSLEMLILSNLPKLLHLDCHGDTALRKLLLANLPKLQDLNCCFCPSLDTFVGDRLYNCSYVDCTGCSKLTELPILALGAKVDSSGTNCKSFFVELEKLKTEPLLVLCNLTEVLLRDKRMPNIVTLNSEGVHHKGLRGQFVRTLLKNLFQEKESSLNLMRLSEGVLPLLEKYDEMHAEAFKGLGALIALASECYLPLCRFLSPAFYSVLRTMPVTVDLTKPLDESLEKGIFKEIFQDNSNESLNESVMLSVFSAFGFKKMRVEEPLEPIALPILFAAQGFKGMLRDEELKKISELPSDVFETRVAGREITWKWFEGLAQFTQSKNGERTKEYFRTFFTKYEKNQALLADLIEYFSPSRSFNPNNYGITVKDEFDEESLFEFSTHFQMVTIPFYTTYDKFEEKLFKSIEFK